MRLYSKEEWAMIPWPATDEGIRMRSFFEPLLKEGISTFISNASSQLYILHIDDLFIPLTVNEKEYRNSYICSIYSFILYAEEEMKRHRKHLLRTLLYPFLQLMKLWFRITKINQLVIVNNFLLSTNLYDNNLLPDQARRLCHFLQNQFPHHAIVFRSLNRYTEQELTDTLHALGSCLITTRSIYFFDPNQYSSLSSKKRWIIQKDKKLVEQDKIEIVRHHDFQSLDAPAIKKLYDLLYLEKYSNFNPAFTTRFFEQVIQDKNFTLIGIRYEGNLAGFIGYFKQKGVMTTPIVGYDTTLPETLGLYRMLTAQVLQESLASCTIFHMMSSGVGHFKRQRGAFQELEAMAVLCTHLPFFRRFIWKTLGALFNKVGAKVLIKYKL
ncbi:MAG: GNAT family N-acetyltransferase [Rhabdochlamydiaceae bacterium]